MKTRLTSRYLLALVVLCLLSGCAGYQSTVKSRSVTGAYDPLTGGTSGAYTVTYGRSPTLPNDPVAAFLRLPPLTPDDVARWDDLYRREALARLPRIGVSGWTGEEAP